MKCLSFLLLLVFNIHFVYGQSIDREKIDSLQNELSSAKDNFQKVSILLSLSQTTNFDSASYENAKKAIVLAEKINFTKGQSTGLRYAGNYYTLKSDSVKALYNYNQALKICNQTKDKKGAIKILQNIGKMYCDFLNFPKSKDYYQQAISIAEEINDQSLLCELFGDYGYVFYQSLNFPKAFEYYQKALDICEKTHNRHRKIFIIKKVGELYFHLDDFDKTLQCADQIIRLGNETGAKKEVAFAFAWRGNILMNSGKIEESLRQYEKSIKIRKEIKDEEGLADDYANIAFGYQLLSDYAMALKYHRECYHLVQKNNYKFGEILYLKDMGFLIQNAPDSILTSIGIPLQSRYQVSLEYEKKALQIAEKIGNAPQRTYILEFMISAYEKLADYQSAYTAVQALTALKNEMTGQQIKAEIARKEAQYYFEKKDTEEKAWLKLRYSIAMSIILIVALIGFLLLYYTRMKKKKEKEIYLANQQIIELEKEKIESELNRAKKDIHQFVGKINEKNELISRASDELRQLHNLYDIEKTELKNTLAQLKTTSILTDEDWRSFLTGFDKLYPFFAIKAKKQYPNITTAELRFLMLAKIGLATRQMADALGVSPNSIRVTWKRVRTKLDGSANDTPESLIKAIEETVL